MAHEELKKQWEEDCKNHDRPWELWECKGPDEENFHDFLCHPSWADAIEYRRKKPSFQPEYFTGLNWRDALPLLGTEVEFSDDPDTHEWDQGTLCKIDKQKHTRFIDERGCFYEYIRTTPETHSTIPLTVNGKEWVLPMPETVVSEYGTVYWIWASEGVMRQKWTDHSLDKAWLDSGVIHLSEDRAKAWVDFWREAILGAVRG